ncbi:hypothetical protein ACN4EK_16525 [Pantanalinema rosaneae CENA516]|uniref:hypothetical protein n=1 Tax=Pantanalinema rosaneae TaxID=1620701 RepID=UPI003D6E7D13
MKRWLPCFAGLVALGIVGYALVLLADNPSGVIYQHVSCPTLDHTKAKGFQVLSTHRWSKGMVVLYSALCPTQDGKSSLQRVFGHQVVQRNGMSWHVSSSDSYGTGRTPTSPEKLIEYGISRSQSQEGDRYTILYGQVLTPKVKAVEATFNNGMVLQQRTVNGSFALLSPDATDICELRILGKDNQILRQKELGRPLSPLVPKSLVSHDRVKHRCLPVSNYL